MTMKFGTENFKAFAEARKAYASVLKNKEASTEDRDEAFGNMMNALQEDSLAEIDKRVNSKVGEFETAQGAHMSADELHFFNELGEDVKTDVGSKNEILLPETTINEIFEDLTTQHPLLAALNLKTMGLRMKILRSETSGTVVWGKVFDEIKGQLDAAFSEDSALQNKVTAFVVIPNDALEYGAAWLKTFVVTQITEAFAVGLESAFLIGDGNSKPIGLNRNVAKDAPVTGGVYPEKKSAGTLTLADPNTTAQEIGGIVKTLSRKENGHPVVASGNVVLVVQPGAAIDFQAASTVQNVNGQWVFALPFNPTIIESEFVPDGKVIAFVKGRYDAYVAGGINIKTFDQTLAMEDMLLYTAKQFAFGKAKDNNAALVFDLSLKSSAAAFKNPDITTPVDSEKSGN